jgi:hypothetical protein
MFISSEVALSIPGLIFLIICNSFVHRKGSKILKSDTNSLLINYVSATGIVIGAIGFIISAAPFFSNSASLINITNYEYDLSLLLSSLSVFLLLLLLACVPLKLFMNQFKVVISQTTLLAKSNLITSLSDYKDRAIKLRTKFIFISLFMLLSIIMALIPHQPQLNFDNQQIGVDTDYYVKWTNALIHAVDYREIIHQAFVVQNFGNVPLTLIFLFAMANLANGLNLYTIMQHMPLILGPLLVLVVFLFTRELTSSDRQALLASFLTSVSFQALIGIYAGFYANWLALIIGYSSFLFLLKSLKYPNSKINLAFFSALLIILMFTHIHTWSVLVVAMGLFTIVMLKLKYYCRKRIALVLLVLLSSFAIDVIRTSITGSSPAIQKDMDFVKSTATGLTQFASRWANLARLVYSFLGGQFNNFIIFSLGLYWLFQSNARENSTILVMIFLSIGLVAFLIGDYRFQARIFYDIPFQIPAAIALSTLRRFPSGTLVTIPICIWLVSLASRSVSNFPSAHSS